MSCAKENANALQNRCYEARSGSGAKDTGEGEGVPNARVSRFSLASPEKREKITPVLQIVEERENLNGREKKCRSLLFLAPFFSSRLDFPLHSLSAPGSPRMAKNGAARNPNSSQESNATLRADFH